jgi:hypothetical protein
VVVVERDGEGDGLAEGPGSALRAADQHVQVDGALARSNAGDDAEL